MNALQIIQQVCATVGLDQPVSLSNAADNGAQRITAITNRAIAMIRREHPWQAMQRDIICNAFVNNPAFDKDGINIKLLIPDYDYISTKCIYEIGSLSPVEYLEPSQFLSMQSGYSFSCNKYFTVLGNKFKFLPMLSEADFKISLCYQSNAAVIDTENKSGYKQLFTKDGDFCDFEDELIILAAIYKYKQELGLSYAEAMADYQQRLETLKNTDTVMPVIRPSYTNNLVLDIPNTCLGKRGD